MQERWCRHFQPPLHAQGCATFLREKVCRPAEQASSGAGSRSPLHPEECPQGEEEREVRSTLVVGTDQADEIACDRPVCSGTEAAREGAQRGMLERKPEHRIERDAFAVVECATTAEAEAEARLGGNPLWVLTGSLRGQHGPAGEEKAGEEEMSHHKTRVREKPEPGIDPLQ